MTKARGEYLSEEVHRQCLQYMCSAIELSPTYKLMKPHLEVILNNMIFPCLCLSESDIELFTDDPTEFVRKINDIQEDWLDPRTAAINLLQVCDKFIEMYSYVYTFRTREEVNSFILISLSESWPLSTKGYNAFISSIFRPCAH